MTNIGYKNVLVFLHAASFISLAGAGILTILGFVLNLNYIMTICIFFMLISTLSGLAKRGSHEKVFIHLLLLSTMLLIVQVLMLASGLEVIFTSIILSLTLAGGSMASASLSYIVPSKVKS